ncbi:MAG: tryptophan 2,3-dioxygenase family protein [Vulcanimicrobiota bacterium]
METTPTVPRTETGLSYGEYLKIPELLDLQQRQSSPPHHDEMLFIIIHQAYELWFKLILHEMECTRTSMSKGKILRAAHTMKRVHAILELLVKQIHILETMTPAEFLQFRDKLNPASGFQSLQFREIEFLAGLKQAKYMKSFAAQPELQARLQKRLDEPSLREAYFEMLRDLGYALPETVTRASKVELEADEDPDHNQVMASLIEIYQNPDSNLPLYLLSEAFVEFDLQLDLWREHHVRVVERSIGFKKGTGGSSGVGYLRSTTGRRCFPFLWDVRTYLKKEANVW